MDFRQDVRFAVRRLARERSFTVAAVLTLAIGIGATTAVFTAVDGVLLQPLRYERADRIVHIVSHNVDSGPARTWVMSLPYFLGLRERATTVTGVGGYDSFSSVTRQRLSATVRGQEGAARLLGTRMSPALFSTLRATPILGRIFEPAEEQPGRNAVVIISHRTWQNIYGSDRGVLGRSFTLDGRIYSIVGVTASDFAFPDAQTDFWIPLTPREIPPSEPRSDSPDTYYSDAVYARLVDGVTVQAANSEIDAILRAIDLELVPKRNAQIREQYRQRAALPRRAEAVLMGDELVASVRPALRLLSLAVALVLLIACANVVNLLLARSGSRQREMAIRAALGAGPGRLARQVMTETTVLALAGGAVGTALAYWAAQIAIGLAPAGIPRIEEIRMNRAVLLYALCVSFFTGAAVGLLPAVRVLRADVMHALMRLTQEHTRALQRNLVVIGQVASTTVLLIGAGLLIRSFVALVNVNPGYDPRDVFTFQLVLPVDYAGDPQRVYDELMSRLEDVPAVQSAGASDVLPIVGSSAFHLSIPGLPVPPGAGDTMVMRVVRGDYFSALGIRVLEGRTFAARDTARTPEPILVNRELVRRYFGGRSPLGAIVGRAPSTYEVIGIVDNVRHAGLHAAIEPEYYVDLRNTGLASTIRPYFVVRTRMRPADLAPIVRGLVRQIDPQLGVELNVASMAAIVSRSVERPRFQTTVITVFAAIALLLAALGVYGVMAYSVEQRTREIGVRMALGAARGDVMGLVLRQGAAIIGSGIIIGIAGAAAVTRYLEGILFGLTPLDPLTFLAAPLIFVAVAALAAYVPTRRALQVDPVVALRCE